MPDLYQEMYGDRCISHAKDLNLVESNFRMQLDKLLADKKICIEGTRVLPSN